MRHALAYLRPPRRADEFRAQLNPLLARYEMPLELSATGEVVALAPDEMRGLLDAPIPFFADHDLVTSRVEAAIALYVYLATIHAVLRLKERESKAAAVQQA
jgi:hypothetical protein